MARRALIIGLGSNGYEVCDWLIRRITWEYGGLDKTPWVQFLWFETAPFAEDSSFGQNGYHIKVEATDFAALRDQPEKFADTYDLQRWTDPAIMQVPGAITAGASNMRMVGRIAFLYNLETVRNQIRARLNLLNSLTEAQAKAARDAAGASETPVLLGDEIDVYVVGTLCGGTCSGSFIDMGYLLHAEFGEAFKNLRRTGIFSVPHPIYTNKRQRANVYSALVELNHYAAGHTYSAQYPFNPGRATTIRAELPYDFNYIVQTTGGSSDDYENLKVTIAQYLHSDIFLPDIRARDGARDNIKAYTVKPDRKGAPQQYLTFGTSTIEFPAYLVVQACCYRLGADALTQWLSIHPLGDGEMARDATRELLISRDALHGQLLQVADTSIKDRISRALDDATSAGAAGAHVLHEAEEMLDRAFLTSNTANVASNDQTLNASLPPGFIADTIQRRNSGPALATYKKNLAEWVQAKLLDLDAGPDYCQQLLEYLDNFLGARIRDISSPEAQQNRQSGIDGARENMEMARGRVEVCLKDWVLGLMGAGIGKSMAVSKYLREYQIAANDYYDWRLQGLLEPTEAETWRKLQEWVRAMLARIADPTQGLRAQGEALRDRLALQLKALDDSKPPLNGESIFEPGKTIAEMYQRNWRLRAQNADANDASATPQTLEHNARRAFLASWDALPRRDSQTGAWIPYFERSSAPKTPEQLKADLRRAEAHSIPHARDHFRELFKISVFDEFEPTNGVLVKDALEKSRVLLDIGTHLKNRYEDADQKRYGMVFFKGADTAQNAPNTQAGKFYNTLEPLRTSAGFALNAEETDSAQSIIFLQEQAAYSLPLIAGLRSVDNPDLNDFRASYEDESRLQTIHARRDVPQWEPLGGSLDPEDNNRKALFLIALSWFKDANRTQRLIRPLSAPRPGAAFIFDLNPPLPPSQTSQEFPANLKEISTLLRNHERLRKRLEDEVMRLRNSGQPTQLVSDILLMTRNVSRLNLREGDILIDEKRAFDLVTEFWERDAAMTEAFEKGYRPDESMLEGWKKGAAEGFLNEGYYCPCPRQIFLAATKDAVPGRCPECKLLLREVGLRS